MGQELKRKMSQPMMTMKVVTNIFKRYKKKMYIKDETRCGYNASNRLLLHWLDKKHPKCVSENAKYTRLQQTFIDSQPATASPAVKYKNRAVTANKALELVASANDIESSPIIFSTISSRLFVDFLLHYCARLKGNNFLSKTGCGGFRSAYKELHRQCGTSINPELEAGELKEKFKGLFLRGGHVEEEKQQKGRHLAEGKKDPMSFQLCKFLCRKMVQDSGKDAIFAHVFLTLTRNLMCRSKKW